MIRRSTFMLFALLTGATPLAAQTTPAPSKADDNRIPAYGSGNLPNAALPPIPSFGGGDFVGPPAPQQPYVATPPLSPWLNLNRSGVNSGVGLYNFVRPAQQAQGNYVGRGPGGYNPGSRYGIDPDVRLEADTSLRPAGTTGAFMNYGRFFNSMGTIGTSGRPPAAAPAKKK